jgi:hypothetical protein
VNPDELAQEPKTVRVNDTDLVQVNAAEIDPVITII